MPAVSCVPLADTKIAFAFYNKIRRITMRIGSGCHMEGAVYYGYGTLMTAKVIQIKNGRAKLEVYYSNGEKSISKWKHVHYVLG